MVKNELRRSGFEDLLAAGIVLTGGASKVKGVIELAEGCFETPVRLGCAQQISGLSEVVDNPSLSTGVGLLMHGVKQQFDNTMSAPSISEGPIGMWHRMKNWFSVNF